MQIQASKQKTVFHKAIADMAPQTENNGENALRTFLHAWVTLTDLQSVQAVKPNSTLQGQHAGE